MKQRLMTPDAEIDAIEEEWWNNHAHLVEAVWAMPPILREAARRHYLQKVRKFFLAGNSNRPAKIIEIGCGSGWVGQMIAEPDVFHIMGIDLSRSQIALAEESAAQAGLQHCCDYYCANLADFTAEKKEENPGVLIHAILHHLSWRELDSLLEQITVLGQGTKVFIYEPVYLTKPAKPMPALVRSQAARVAGIPLQQAQQAVSKHGEGYQADLAKAVQNMCEYSDRQGWVLSPKEVVFQESELISLLSKYFHIRRHYLCNHTTIPAAQAGALYDNPSLHRLLAEKTLPLARTIDTLLWETALIREITDFYVFLGFECEVK